MPGIVPTGARAVTRLLVILAICLSAAQVSIATPTEELAHAAKVSGAPDVNAASSEQFLRAFKSILARTKPGDVPQYVGAAVKMRSDLADQIVVAALSIPIGGKNVAGKNVFDEKDACDRIGQIVSAAVAADPKSAVAIVRAAIGAEPLMKDCIVAAAIAAAPDQAVAIRQAAGEFARTALLVAPGSGAFNPINFAQEGAVNSAEQPPASR